MKVILLCLLLLCAVSCERFPTNPPLTLPPGPSVTIEHLETDYVTVDTSINGIVSNKVNVLSFYMKTEHLTAKALEIYGRAVMEGPPDDVEHAILFRTDNVAFDIDGTGYDFNTLDWVYPESEFTLVRPKFPTNDYAPFSGDQGKIVSVTVTEVWAYDEKGNKISVNFTNGS